jgi:hypothetical protein
MENLFKRPKLPVTVFTLCILLGKVALAGEWDAHTAITQVSMTNPTANEVWLMDTPHTLTCTTSTDTDRWRSTALDAWINYDDSVTHYWTAAAGTFPNNNNVGTSVAYIAPQPGAETINVYANDDYAAVGNGALVDESATTDTETVTIVGLEVHKVGFTGGNHALMRTPVGTPSEWDDGTVAISNYIWILGDADNAVRNFVCYTKSATPTVIARARVPVALTEGSSFHLGAIDGLAAYSWSGCSIGAGQTESTEVSCTSDRAFVNTVFKGSVNLAWKFICVSGANQQRDLNASSHNLYLTYGTPAGGSRTVKRIDCVCAAAHGQSQLVPSAHAVYAAINTNLGYDLSADNWGPTPIWRLHDSPTWKSQCPGLAMYVNAHFEMLGLGSGTLIYCYATSAGLYAGTPTYAAQTRAVEIGAGKHIATTVHDDLSGIETLTHFDGSTPPGANNFEATLLFAGEYYALGVGTGIFATPKEVVEASFGANIVWRFVDAGWVWGNCGVIPWVYTGP